jgi:hypothetical protein
MIADKAGNALGSAHRDNGGIARGTPAAAIDDYSADEETMHANSEQPQSRGPQARPVFLAAGGGRGAAGDRARQAPAALWEPAAGDGAIVRPLRAAGFSVVASDLVDYGGADIKAGIDYLKAPLPPGVRGIVTNPPYMRALAFARKARDHLYPPKGVTLRCIIIVQTSHRHPPSSRGPVITPWSPIARWGGRYANPRSR